jgi:hypothetical protein
MKRSRRVVIGCCPTCRRDGWEQAKPYALWTPEEYADFGPEMITSERDAATRAGIDLRSDVLCIPHAGASVYEAANEARDLAREWAKPVAFMFNEKPVRVTAESDTEAVVREWWVARYGETPEQSWTRR